MEQTIKHRTDDADQTTAKGGSSLERADADAVLTEADVSAVAGAGEGGAAIGSAIGGALGGTLGLAGGPVGSAIGASVGSAVGGYLGSRIQDVGVNNSDDSPFMHGA